MKDLPNIIFWSTPAFILLVILEVVSFKLHGDDDELGYEPKDTATSLAMGLGSLFADRLTGMIPTFLTYDLLYAWTPARGWLTDHLLYTLPSAIFVWFGLFVAQDFLYYWSHRGHHLIRVLWASHVVHHSSRRFNLSTALRQSWTGFTSWLFYTPLVLAGVHPGVLLMLGSVNLLYQFWIHTERIDKMWRPYEFLFNTPSHHRVHHASQGTYLDRNFAGTFIVWDRLFGSFEPEVERPVYGLTKNLTTYNPVRVAFHEWAALGRDLASTHRPGEWFGYLFRNPGWRPERLRTPEPAIAELEPA